MNRDESAVLGYHNVKTHILWEGYNDMFAMMSDSSHPDNQGRLQTLGNDTEHGRLDWECVTDPAYWDELVARHGADQDIGGAKAKPAKAAPKRKPRKKPVAKKPAVPKVPAEPKPDTTPKPASSADIAAAAEAGLAGNVDKPDAEPVPGAAADRADVA